MKQKRAGWFKYLNNIAEKIASKSQVSAEEWQELFAVADTFYKCSEGRKWAKENPEMEISFYQKMIALQGRTFRHKKILAVLAKERGDNEIFNACLGIMVQSALETKRFAKARCATVLKLMKADDPRRLDVQNHLNHVKSLS
ncbi:MAG: hypothetical protein Q7T51_02350 [Candidatus Moranbacteria bacterium]|nr:hypothetical protein [Candidatus Moranbacteria bacterium]